MRALALSLLIAAAPCAAQETAGRYAFVPVEAGALRLDTVSGAVSLCKVEAGATVCAAVPGTSAQGEAEVSALAARTARLEGRIAALEARPPGAALADDESIDRVMVLADRMMRRFFGLVREMKHDMDSGEL